jgi:hypothetical protein
MEDLSMCKFCKNNDEESITTLKNKQFDVEMGKRVLGDYLLSLELMRLENGNYLHADLFDEYDEVVGIEVSIEYCPFCGEKLQIVKEDS